MVAEKRAGVHVMSTGARWGESPRRGRVPAQMWPSAGADVAESRRRCGQLGRKLCGPSRSHSRGPVRAFMCYGHLKRSLSMWMAFPK